mgnify:CR=1 FL=1
MSGDSGELPAPFELSGWSYRFVRRLGRGGFGSVYEAERSRDGDPQRVAVKVLHAASGASRFRDELRLLMRLDHPAFPRAYDVAVVGGNEAVVMELVQGRALDFAAGRRLPLRVVAEIGAEVASALDDAWNFVPPGETEALHIAHRDIKPANLMVDRTARVRVLDLGGASAAAPYRDAETRRDGGSPLTPNFCAPEVPRSMVEEGVHGRIAGSPPEDVYALGATLVALATGAEYTSDWRHAPGFHREALSRLLGTPLHAALVDVLHLDPAARPSFAELRRRLREVALALGGEGLEGWLASGAPTDAALAGPPAGATRDPEHADRAAAAAVVASPGPTSPPAPVPPAPTPAATRPSLAPLAMVFTVVLGAAALVVVAALAILLLQWPSEEAPAPVVMVPPSIDDQAPLPTGGAPDGMAPPPVDGSPPASEPGASGPGASGEASPETPSTGHRPAPSAPPPASPAPVVSPSPAPATGAPPSGGAEPPSAGVSPTPAPAAGSTISVAARDGCAVTVDGVAVAESTPVSPGQHQVACSWPITTADGADSTVEKSTRVTVPEGGSLVVECAPLLSRCGVKR